MNYRTLAQRRVVLIGQRNSKPLHAGYAAASASQSGESISDRLGHRGGADCHRGPCRGSGTPCTLVVSKRVPSTSYDTAGPSPVSEDQGIIWSCRARRTASLRLAESFRRILRTWVRTVLTDMNMDCAISSVEKYAASFPAAPSPVGQRLYERRRGGRETNGGWVDDGCGAGCPSCHGGLSDHRNSRPWKTSVWTSRRLTRCFRRCSSAVSTSSIRRPRIVGTDRPSSVAHRGQRPPEPATFSRSGPASR